MKKYTAFLTLLFGVSLAGCTSLVYTPYLHLPAAPMRESEIGISSGPGGLPETNSATTSLGGEGMLSYAITDNVTLRGGAWSRVGDITSAEVDGTSLDAIIAFANHASDAAEPLVSNSSNNSKYTGFDFALVPRAMSLYGSNTLGLAGSVSAAMWMPSFWVFRPYVAIGGIAGTGYTSNNNGESGHGYGMLNNIGVTTTFNSHFSINAEIANPIVWTTMTGAVTFYLTPSLTVNYAF